MPLYKRLPKDIPLTSEKQLQDTIKARNALNKQRSKAMERKIAQQLRGRRVPMSGAAAQYKGDVEIPLKNHPGHYIIECKLSARQHNRTLEPWAVIRFDWFEKIHNEAKAMNAKFGILIFHFQNTANDYVFIRRDVITKLIRYLPEYADILNALSTQTPIQDLRFNKAGKLVSSSSIFRNKLEATMIAYKGYKAARVILPDGEYTIMHLITFKELTQEL